MLVLKGRKSDLIMLLVLFSIKLSGQNGVVQVGAKPAAIGYTYAALYDNWSVFFNPAGINETERTSALFSFENKFNISGLKTLGAAFITSQDIGNLGVALFRFGDDIYNEQSISVSYSNSFGITSLGIRANYLQYSSELIKNSRALVVDFGGITSLSDRLNFGAYIRNLNQARLNRESDQSIPIILNAGFSYRPTAQLLINGEVEKDIDFDPGVRLGIDYAFLQRFSVRAGILTYPFTNYFGLGFNTSRLDIDYSITRNANLGVSHQASVSYHLKEK